MMKKTILIFEDKKRIYTLVARSLIEQHYEVIVASDVRDALQMMEKYPVCIMIADPECLQIEKVRSEFNRRSPQTPIIYINCLFGFEVILSQADKRENYFLVEDFDTTTLLSRINKMAPPNDLYFKNVKANNTLLTPQEKRILCLLEKGHTNKEISDALGLKIATVRTYNYVLFQKLSVKNRTHAIMVAKEARLI